MLTFLFDVDDTLYDQTWPFREAAREFGLPEGLDLAALFAVSRRYSDEVFLASVRGEITMEEMYIYRVKNALADWREAVRLSAGILSMQGNSSAPYEKSILESLAAAKDREEAFQIILDCESLT